jgi:hypothetical protein
MKTEGMHQAGRGRREFLQVGASAAGVALAACATPARGGQSATPKSGHEEAEVTPGEDPSYDSRA